MLAGLNCTEECEGLCGFFALQQIFKVFVFFTFLQVLSLRASSSAKV